MAPLIENVDDRKLEYAPGRKIRVRRFVPLTNDDYIVDDGAAIRRDYTVFSRNASVGITDQPTAFYAGVGPGSVLSFVQGQNLYVRNSANREVVVVNIL